jgi:hypothetical protein
VHYIFLRIMHSTPTNLALLGASTLPFDKLRRRGCRLIEQMRSRSDDEHEAAAISYTFQQSFPP